LREIYKLFHSNNKFHQNEKEEIEISLNNEKFIALHFNFDKNDLYLKSSSGGGVVSSCKFSDCLIIFIIGIYYDTFKIQNSEGLFENQSLAMIMRAIDNTSNHLNKISKLLIK